MGAEIAGEGFGGGTLSCLGNSRCQGTERQEKQAGCVCLSGGGSEGLPVSPYYLNFSIRSLAREGSGSLGLENPAWRHEQVTSSQSFHVS